MDLKTMNEHFLTIEICVLSAVLVICGFAFFSRNRSGTRFAISIGYELFKWDFIGPFSISPLLAITKATAAKYLRRRSTPRSLRRRPEPSPTATT
jgi:hypothetical protein